MKPGIHIVLSLFLIQLVTVSCNDNNTQIAENTFVHGDKVYKIIDNELREIGDLDAKEIKKFEVSKPKQRNMGTSNLSFVKDGAESSLKALYRGNYLYYTLNIKGLNDLRESFSPGVITVEFIDEFGFILHSTEIPTNAITNIVGDDGTVYYLEYSGKTEMSTEINSAIKKYNLTASIKRRTRYSF